MFGHEMGACCNGLVLWRFAICTNGCDGRIAIHVDEKGNGLASMVLAVQRWHHDSMQRRYPLVCVFLEKHIEQHTQHCIIQHIFVAHIRTVGPSLHQVSNVDNECIF